MVEVCRGSDTSYVPSYVPSHATLTKLTTKTEFESAVIPQDREGRTMIDARQLHGWLKVREQFSAWVARRAEEYGFEEGSDFYRCVVKTRGRPRTDYLPTLDTAKELAMVERTERGRATRRYFIEMERAARQMGLVGVPRK